jgi:hypothetical protein
VILSIFILVGDIICFLTPYLWTTLAVTVCPLATLTGSVVHFSEIFPLPFIALSSVPQGCVLGHSLLNIYINNQGCKIKHYELLLFDDNI